jgi:phosphonate transport system substrate-binding protein
MKKSLKKLTLLVLFLFVACALSFAAKEEVGEAGASTYMPDYEGVEELTFGIISTDTVANLKQSFDPFLKDMEAQLRIPVKSYFASDYAGVIIAMANRKVDVAWFGNKSCVEAVLESEGNVEIVAQLVGLGRDPGYQSLLITHVDNPLYSLDDVLAKHRSLDFGNGDVNSTSGYLMPTALVWKPRNIDPKKYFNSARNASHGANVQAVLAKHVDFATNNTEQMVKLKREDPEGFEKIRIIWESPVIPKDPIVVRKDLPRELKSAVQAFLLAYGRLGTDADIAHAKEVLYNMSVLGGAEPFFSSTNQQLIPFFKLKFSILVDDKKRFQEVQTLGELAPKYL